MAGFKDRGINSIKEMIKAASNPHLLGICDSKDAPTDPSYFSVELGTRNQSAEFLAQASSTDRYPFRPETWYSPVNNGELNPHYTSHVLFPGFMEAPYPAPFKTYPLNRTYGNFEISGYANVQIGDQHIHYISSQGPRLSTSEVELKKALWYESMDARKAQLEAVTPASMAWIWSQTSFPRWLHDGQGFYWISGKPASGKSTLLNYLIGRDKARLIYALQQTHSNPLLLHFFFDFRSGSSTANSMAGLLRSFLLPLIEASDQVKTHCLDRYEYRLPGAWPDDANQLQKILTEALKHEHRLICGFVDGLDEFQGDLAGLLKSLEQIQSSSRVKLCLASRFDSRIAQQVGAACFRMEDHNSSTIRAYVEAALSGLQFSELSFRESCLQSLKATIENRAEGVILWVKFAVSEILDAFYNGDKIEDAEKRLDGLSTELTDIYSRIWSRLATDQQKQAAVLLFVVMNWSSHIRAGQLLFLGQLMTAFSILMDRTFEQILDFNADVDLNRFRRRLYCLIGGFVDLVGATAYTNESMVRLNHETLIGSLSTNKSVLRYHQEIELSFNPKCLSTQILTMVMDNACDAIDETTVTEPGHISEWAEHLSHLPRKDLSRSSAFTWSSLYTALLLGESRIGYPRSCRGCAQCILKVQQSWIGRKKNYSHYSNFWSNAFSHLSQNVWKVSYCYPEGFSLLSGGETLALELLFQQDRKIFSETVVDELWLEWEYEEYRWQEFDAGLHSEDEDEDESDGEDDGTGRDDSEDEGGSGHGDGSDGGSGKCSRP